MVVIPDVDIISITNLTTNMTLYSLIKVLLILLSHFERLIKIPLLHSITPPFFFNHLFHKVVSSILTAINFHLLTVLVVIAAENLIAKIAVDMFLIRLST